ncbi:TetR/AcrR family transcriptional regulator [Neolewinella persica]|uniref:TetR/AcrR family transcriptional regulator n=1 Tax=Neolewinella persica TaxID=70998 RepID=UPI000362C815|nr:TetR/AcrR family transcriptional regulator [Neolewinella persica]
MSEKATPTEEKILRAAEKIFLEKGYAGTRMQVVADEAEINKAMLHYYFRSKEKLFRVILTDAVNEVLPILIASLSSDKKVIPKLHDLVSNYTALLLKRPQLPLFIMHELSQNQGKFVTDLALRANTQPVMLTFFQQVVEAGESGEVYPISPVQLLLHVLSLTVFPFIARPMIATMANLPDELFQQVLDERTQEVIRFLDAGLKP